MAHCTKCGAVVTENAGFCPNCGQPQSGGAGAPGATSNPGSTQVGMAENVAGLLCYVLGWITGLIFFFIDKRPFVRYHAAQSIVVFGGLHILRIILGLAFGFGAFMGGPMMWTGWSFAIVLFSLLSLLAFVLWIICMIKAFQGERFEVPIAAPFAKNLAGN